MHSHSPRVGIRTCSDYSPFGVELDGRTVSGGYRFGFNGKEINDDILGPSNYYDFGARMYASRIGRWLSCDSHFSDYPSISGYCFAIANPNRFIDPNGKWVVEIQKNQQGKYKLNFIPEENDNLKTLSIQLGLSEETILKAHPELSRLVVTKSTILTLENLKQVQNINAGINYIGENQSFTNCANLADRCDGGSSNRDVQFNSSDDGVSLYEDKLSSYIAISDENAQIGDVMMFSLGSEYLKEFRIYNEKLCLQFYYDDPEKAKRCLENKNKTTPYLLNKEKHFAVVVLLDKSGEFPSQMIQKNGRSIWDMKVDNVTDTRVKTNTFDLVYERSNPKSCGGLKPQVYRNPRP